MSETLVSAPDASVVSKAPADAAVVADPAVSTERSVADELSEIFAAGFTGGEAPRGATPPLKTRVLAPWGARPHAAGRLAIAAALAAGVLGLAVGAILVKSDILHSPPPSEAGPSFAALAYAAEPSQQTSPEAPGGPGPRDGATASSAILATSSPPAPVSLKRAAKPAAINKTEIKPAPLKASATTALPSDNRNEVRSPIGQANGPGLAAMAPFAPLPSYSSAVMTEPRSAYRAEAAQPSPRPDYFAGEPESRQRPSGAFDDCGVDRPCSAYMAAMQADQKLRRAYADAIRSGAPRSVILRAREDWAELRTEAAGRPDELVRGYGELRQRLSRAREEARARQGYRYDPYVQPQWDYER